MKNFLKITLLIISILTVGICLSDAAVFADMDVQCAALGFLPLLSSCGLENMGGMKNRLAFIPVCEVTAVPTLPANPVSEEDLVTATGNFEFKEPTGKPIYIYATDKTVKFSVENQGETDGQSFKMSGEFFHPGTKVEAAAFARKVNNTPGYLLLEDPESNQYIVGQPGLPCTIKPSFDFGMARTDRRGFKFTFEADSYCPFIRMAAPYDLDSLTEIEDEND